MIRNNQGRKGLPSPSLDALPFLQQPQSKNPSGCFPGREIPSRQMGNPDQREGPTASSTPLLSALLILTTLLASSPQPAPSWEAKGSNFLVLLALQTTLETNDSNEQNEQQSFSFLSVTSGNPRSKTIPCTEKVLAGCRIIFTHQSPVPRPLHENDMLIGSPGPPS